MVIWVYKQPQLKPLWLLLVPGQTVGRCHLALLTVWRQWVGSDATAGAALLEQSSLFLL